VNEPEALLTVPVFLPLLVGFIMLFLPTRKLRQYMTLSVLTLIIATFCTLISFWIFLAGRARFSWVFFSLDQVTLSLLLLSDPLRSFVLMFAMGFGLLVALYCLDSAVLNINRVGEFYGAILLALGGSAGVILSDHLIMLWIFWEIVTLSLYMLITVGRSEARHAATKTFAMLGAADAALIMGILLLWQSSGTLIISDIAVTAETPISVAAFMLLAIAGLTKAGAMPLHTWLPASGESAPSPAMALLPAALDKLLGIYLLVLMVRHLFVLTPGILSTVLAVIGAATIILAVMVAMVQHNLKRLLSYHAISQVGYMVLGIATGTAVGLAGALFHMLNHAIYKSCLFLCGGSVEQQAHTAELDQLGGLGRKMPVTFAASLIAALSISGVPPFNGFVSKWMVYQGIIQMGSDTSHWGTQLWPLWLVCAMFGSALTLASFVKIIHSVFLSRLPSDLQDTEEVPPAQSVPMVVLAGMCVLLGVMYIWPLQWLIYPALGVGSADVPMNGAWHSGTATALLVLGVLVGLGVLVVGGWLAGKVRRVPTWTCGERQDNDRMIIPGTHFYKTVSSMKGLRGFYQHQDRGHFDLYNHSGAIGLTVTAFLRWLHNGALPMYLTWVTVGLLLLVLMICQVQ